MRQVMNNLGCHPNCTCTQLKPKTLPALYPAIAKEGRVDWVAPGQTLLEGQSTRETLLLPVTVLPSLQTTPKSSISSFLPKLKAKIQGFQGQSMIMDNTVV